MKLDLKRIFIMCAERYGGRPWSWKAGGRGEGVKGEVGGEERKGATYK